MMKCGQCGKEIRSGDAFCMHCGAVVVLGGAAVSAADLKRERRKRDLIRSLRDLGVFVGIVLLIVILNANLLFPWQGGARKNRQVILEYAEEHYPDAKIIGKEFNSAKFFVWNNFMDCIVFECDNIEFGITAEGGKILVDGYCGARAIAQFDKIIQDGFLKPRGITAYTDYGFVDNYYEMYPYTGGLSVELTIFDQGSTPQEVGWLYDFYKYWKEEGAFLTLYGVRISIAANETRKCHIDYDNDSVFSNAKEFYAAFIVG